MSAIVSGVSCVKFNTLFNNVLSGNFPMRTNGQNQPPVNLDWQKYHDAVPACYPKVFLIVKLWIFGWQTGIVVTA
jgi:hypothetical protein